MNVQSLWNKSCLSDHNCPIRNKVHFSWVVYLQFTVKLGDKELLNSQYFFMRISGIGPWVSRIN